jgi:lipopolysaccharide heptosyltransferase II
MPKFLIIRFSSIGDIVLTTPVIRCIKEQVKDAEVHYLTKKSFEKIVSLNPNVSKTHCIEKDISEIIDVLKKEKYDYIIDLHNNIRSLQVKRALGAKSFSFNKLNFKKWLLVTFKINKLPAIHIVERYLAPLKQLGIVNDLKGLEFYIPEKDEINLSSLPLPQQKGYIGIVIGAAHFTKRLPPEKIVEVCKKIQQPIILLGGKEDKEIGEKIATAVGEKVYNACGKYNLQQSASLVKQANAIITNDTGLMHIAAAFKKDIVSVWGNTVPEFGMYPYLSGKGENGRGAIIQVNGLSCRPCSKIGYQKCPKGHFNCMTAIDNNTIVKAVEDI